MSSNLGDAALSFGSDSPRAIVRYGLPLRLALSAFIIFHITAVLFWVMPESTLRQRLWPLTGNYVNRFGLYQGWGMFAPEPSNLNIYLSAVITYQDGSQREWTWPRMTQLDLVTRYQKERYRKFAENVQLDMFAFMWPSLARYVAAVNNDDPTNPPTRVQLWRNWWFVPPPPENGDISKDPPHEWSRSPFFEMSIGESDPPLTEGQR